MLSSMVDLSQLDADMLRPISRDEFMQMAELGMFDDERVELLRGVVVKKPRIGWRHANTVDWLNRELILALGRTYLVRPQQPFAASDWSQPEPDLAVVENDSNLEDHPSVALLLIEVADSSQRRDRGIKLGIYAEAGAPEYWIVDLRARAVEVYSQPAGASYARCDVLHEGDVLRPSRVPGVELAVAELLAVSAGSGE